MKTRAKSFLVFWPDLGRVDRFMANGSCRKDVGHVNGNGYKIIKVNGKMHQVHRLLYAAAKKESIEGQEIDHVNGCKTDNRIENLRLVSHRCNMENRAGACKTNKLGVKGVSMTRDGKYRARIRASGQLFEFYGFDDIESAQECYKKAAAKYHSHNPSAHHD